MSELLNQIDQCIQTRRLFRPGQRILVAVSGGADSMVLLHLLHELAPRHGWRLTAAHLNHQLRGRSSDADERLVRRTAQQLKVPLVVGRADVVKLARTRKLSLEMAARELRHGFLARTARRRGIPDIALAHHADDQLELFFLRLLRGSGGDGLAGMRWQARSPANAEVELVRPLLDQPKAVLLGYAAEYGVKYREDASNAVLDFQRNRVRHELLPLLRSKYQPALDRTILRVMDIVGAEAEFAAGAAREWEEERKGAQFDDLPVAVQRRCVQSQLVGQGVVPDFELVEQLRLWTDKPIAISRAQTLTGGVTGREGRKMGADSERRKGEAPGRLYVVRDSSGRVRLQAPESQGFEAGTIEVELEGATGKVEFEGAKVWWRIGASRVIKPLSAAVRYEQFDADKVGGLVRLRHWRPGDRFQPIGMASSVKLQDFFTNQKVPRDWRRRLIVAVTAGGEVFWVEGMRIGEQFKLTKGTIRGLQWRWKRV